MVELNQQLLLLSAIGADQEHCPMVLELAQVLSHSLTQHAVPISAQSGTSPLILP